MRILLVHNRYQMPGGEDEVFERERRLLESKGHSVATYERDNAEIAAFNPWQKLMLAPRMVWNRGSRGDLARLLARERPDVAHFHNTFPLISPAAYYACREAGVPVVQTLHNPRLLCPAGTFYRDGRLCEDCLGSRVFSPAVRYACYRDSRVRTAVVASMLSLHQWRGTWQNQVDLYVAPTEFYRRKFIEGGLPPDKLVVKPHFVSPDPGPRTEPGDYALFVGRLAPEKGVLTLMRAWSRLKEIPLQIRGEGPLLEWVSRQAAADGSLTKVVGRQTSEAMVGLLKGSRFLVWPSEGYYEVFGLVAIEAFACGVPVIASRIGAMAEVVEDGRTGLCFTPGDPEDLAAKVEWAWTHATEMEAMGRAARVEFEAKYTAERNYQILMDTYAKAVTSRGGYREARRRPARRTEDLGRRFRPVGVSGPSVAVSRRRRITELVTVSIASYNGREFLQRCLNAVSAQTFEPLEIYLVDNASTDGAADFVSTHFPNVKVISSKANLGFGAAHNLVIRKTDSPFVLALNQDAFLSPTFVEELVAAMKLRPEVGIAGGKLYSSRKTAPEGNGEDVIDMTWLDIEKKRRQVCYAQFECDRDQDRAPRFVFAIDGAAMLLRRPMLEDIRIEQEFFDEDFFAGKEDLDISWRAQLRGWKCLYVPSAVGWHVRTFSSKDRRSHISDTLKASSIRNRYLLMLKNDLFPHFLRHLAHIGIYELKILAYVLLYERSSLKGYAQALRLVPRTMKKRKLIMGGKRVDNAYILQWFR